MEDRWNAGGDNDERRKRKKEEEDESVKGDEWWRYIYSCTALKVEHVCLHLTMALADGVYFGIFLIIIILLFYYFLYFQQLSAKDKIHIYIREKVGFKSFSVRQ